ncbi:MAG TPA: AAA family ATPase, partial [Acidobacteriota bacterium]|nr:AAA family ATPase [Acidobacteriota bacterium]
TDASAPRCSCHDDVYNDGETGCHECFAPGTLIRTETGFRPIETIKAGDRVLTAEGTYQAVTKTIQINEIDSLQVGPADRNLAGAEVELVDIAQREYVLKKALDPLRDRYDYIIIDCPPSLGLLTVNALSAADSVLVPIQCEYFALEGVSELLDTLVRIRRSYNPTLAVEGFLLTMFDERTNLSTQVMNDLRDFYGSQVFETAIPRNVRLAEAPSHGKPIILYDVKSRGAESYLRLANEVMSHDKKGIGARAERSASSEFVSR